MKHYEDVIIKPLQVEVVNDNFEEAFRKFKMLVQREGILTLYKNKQAYEKPSQKKRRKQRQALERKLMTESREQLIASGEWDRIQKRKDLKRRQKQEEQLNRSK